MSNEQPQPVLAVYRLGGSGFIVNHAGVPYAKESAETAADLVRQLLMVGTGVPAPARTPDVGMPRVAPAVPQEPMAHVPAGASDEELEKQRRNLMKLVTARINGGMDDREFSAKAREYCPLIDLSVCLDALDRGFMSEPMPWEGGAEAPHAGNSEMLMEDLSEEAPRKKSGLGDLMAGMIDYGPGNVQSMVQDYITDDYTGAVLADGR